jgi:hypothetical protein
VSPEEIELARKRLAIESKLKRIVQRLGWQKFEAQSDRDMSSGWRALLDPKRAAVAVAACGLVGVGIGKWADLNISQKQQETIIILKASEVPQSLSAKEQDVQRARNLLWFTRAGYLTLPKSFVAQLESAALLKEDEPLFPPVVQPYMREHMFPPPVPKDIVATPISTSQINLTWNAGTDNNNVMGYKVFRCKQRASCTQIARITSTTYQDTGLTANTTYGYTVAAFDANGNNSPQSARVDATTFPTAKGQNGIKKD